MKRQTATTKPTTKATTRKAKPKTKELEAYFGGSGLVDVNALQNTQSSLAALGSLSRDVGGGLFLRFTKQGKWLYGKDQDEIGTDIVFAVNPMSFTNGWIGWKAGQVVGEHMCPVSQGMPCDENDLEPILNPGPSDGWSAQLGVEFKALDESEPLLLLYRATSRGGKQAISKLAEEVSKRMNEDINSCLALIVLDSDSYKHKAYGDIAVPVLSVVGWADMYGEPVEWVEDNTRAE